MGMPKTAHEFTRQDKVCVHRTLIKRPLDTLGNTR